MKASWQGAAQKKAYDNDAWAKQAYGRDTDSRWGKSYDSVEARSYDNEHYAREVRADDDQWAEDRDTWCRGDYDEYVRAASASKETNHSLDKKAASQAKDRSYWGGERSDWDAWGRDQDFHEKVSFDNTRAKGYAAESYDEWDNQDADKWGAQAWGQDRDIYGASSSSGKASAGKYGRAGHQGGAYGTGYGKNAAAGSRAGSVWEGASAARKAQVAGYDNDDWAKQAYGEDSDSRWGKSYDAVKARSYENTEYARWLQADDDQWAEDYDRYTDGDYDDYGKAASVWAKDGKKGWGGYGRIGGHSDAASAAKGSHYDRTSGSDWDAYGRDQDLEVDESYKQTWAKSYDAESYDEWDNKDADKWGAQAWGSDEDVAGASSYGARASAGDLDKKAYGDGAYGAQGYGKAYGGAYGSAIGGYGHGAGAYGAGYGKAYGGKAYGAYGQGKASHQDYQASEGGAAARAGYDNDAWAKQASGSDFDSRWGKSYDFVNANEYDDEQYARKVRADDDQWAEDYDLFQYKDVDQYGAAASAESAQPKVTKTTYSPVVSYGGYGYGKGYGKGASYGRGW